MNRELPLNIMQITIHLPNQSSQIEIDRFQSVFSLTSRFHLPVTTQWYYHGHSCPLEKPFASVIEPNDAYPVFTSQPSRKGGSGYPWYVYVFLIILFLAYMFLMAVGFIPIMAQVARLILQKGINQILTMMRYVLGPENPVAWGLGKLFQWIQPIFIIVFVYFFVKYFTIMATYLFFYLRTKSVCSTIRTTDYLSMIIAITFSIIYYFFEFGEKTIEQLKKLENTAIIGPMAQPLAVNLNKMFRKLRTPTWIPLYGQAVSAYFAAVGAGVTGIKGLATPIDMFLDNFPQFMKLVDSPPISMIVDEFKLQKMLQYVNFTYLDEESQIKQGMTGWKIITARWIRWFMDNFMATLRGGLWIIRNICSNEMLLSAEAELADLQGDTSIDPKIRNQLMKLKTREINDLKNHAPIPAQCITSKVEVGTLSGHVSLIVFVISFIVLMIIPR